MKKILALSVSTAIAFSFAPAFAQHGHGAGGGMGMGGVNRANTSHAAGSTGTAAAATHGKTMDQLLTKNTKLSGKIASLTGESAQQACGGFKNLGQCVAAAHVSKNLGVSFACLKSDMTGSVPASGSTCPAGTGTKATSLGRSIQTLSPNADGKSAAKQGEQQASHDLKDSVSNS
jgi:hypothetical protein